MMIFSKQNFLKTYWTTLDTWTYFDSNIKSIQMAHLFGPIPERCLWVVQSAMQIKNNFKQLSQDITLLTHTQVLLFSGPQILQIFKMIDVFGSFNSKCLKYIVNEKLQTECCTIQMSCKLYFFTIIIFMYCTRTILGHGFL